MNEDGTFADVEDDTSLFTEWLEPLGLVDTGALQAGRSRSEKVRAPLQNLRDDDWAPLQNLPNRALADRAAKKRKVQSMHTPITPHTVDAVPDLPVRSALTRPAAKRDPTIGLTTPTVVKRDPTIGLTTPTVTKRDPTIGLTTCTTTIGLITPTVAKRDPTIGLTTPTVVKRDPTIGLTTPIVTGTAEVAPKADGDEATSLLVSGADQLAITLSSVTTTAPAPQSPLSTTNMMEPLKKCFRDILCPLLCGPRCIELDGERCPVQQRRAWFFNRPRDLFAPQNWVDARKNGMARPEEQAMQHGAKTGGHFIYCIRCIREVALAELSKPPPLASEVLARNRMPAEAAVALLAMVPAFHPTELTYENFRKDMEQSRKAMQQEMQMRDPRTVPKRQVKNLAPETLIVGGPRAEPA